MKKPQVVTLLALATLLATSNLASMDNNVGIYYAVSELQSNQESKQHVHQVKETEETLPAPSIRSIWGFLNNASLGAFLGAVLAYFLVMLTDRRRQQNDKKSLKVLIENNRNHAKNKIRTVRKNLAMIKEENKLTGAPIMRFPTQLIKDYQFKVLSLMEENEAQVLDALVYWMEAIDDLLDEAIDYANDLKALVKKNKFGLPVGDDFESEIDLSKEIYIEFLEEAEGNLNHLVRLAGYYIDGDFHKIIEFEHPIG